MEHLSQMLPIVGAKIVGHKSSSQTVTATTTTIDMDDHRRVMFVVQTGTCGTGGSAKLTVQKGTATTTVTTSVGTASITASNKVKVYEAQAEVLGPTYRYVNGKLVHKNGSTTAGTASVVALADVNRYGPGSDVDASKVQSITVAS